MLNDLEQLEEQRKQIMKDIFEYERSLNENKIYKSLTSLEEKEKVVARDLKKNKENERYLTNYIQNWKIVQHSLRNGSQKWKKSLRLRLFRSLMIF